jgi:hypothetical protein
MADTDHAAEILSMLAALDAKIRAGIVTELELLRPNYELAVSNAAASLATAYKVLDIAKSQIAELDENITRFRDEARVWESRIDDDDIEQSVTAKFYHAGFCEHIDKLLAKRLQMTDAMIPVEDEYTTAKNAMAHAEEEMRLFEVNLLNPYLHLGQSTSIYKAFRVGSHGQWIGMLSDACPFEKDAFFHGLDEIAINTGYTTDDLKERQRQYAIQQGLQDFRDNFPSAEKSSAPSGKDIMDNIHARMEQQVLDTIPSVVEDRRYQVAIPTPQKPHMTLPGKG